MNTDDFLFDKENNDNSDEPKTPEDSIKIHPAHSHLIKGVFG